MLRNKENRIWCANCKNHRLEDGSGESQIYSPHEAFTLCEECWLEEDRLIEEEGTNDLPERLAHYKRKKK